jgi:hypothetical protein
LAIQLVGAVAADQHVVAVAAIQVVGAAAADQRVIAALPINNRLHAARILKSVISIAPAKFHIGNRR